MVASNWACSYAAGTQEQLRYLLLKHGCVLEGRQHRYISTKLPQHLADKLRLFKNSFFGHKLVWAHKIMVLTHVGSPNLRALLHTLSSCTHSSSDSCKCAAQVIISVSVLVLAPSSSLSKFLLKGCAINSSMISFISRSLVAKISHYMIVHAQVPVHPLRTVNFVTKALLLLGHLRSHGSGQLRTTPWARPCKPRTKMVPW